MFKNNKLSINPLWIIILALTVLTILNIMAIRQIDTLLNQPESYHQTTVLGAVFKEDAESNVINVDLVRPPRFSVWPGEEKEQDMTLTNTADFNIYMRAAYRIEVRDADGNNLDDAAKWVTVNTNKNWCYEEGYWYYDGEIEAGEAIEGFVDSITYSKEFDDHRDYKVYIPVLIESVEVNETSIDDIDYWPDKKIEKVSIENDDPTTWTQKVVIEQSFG